MESVHGGVVTIRGARGEGTTVTMVLPRLQGKASWFRGISGCQSRMMKGPPKCSWERFAPEATTYFGRRLARKRAP